VKQQVVTSFRDLSFVAIIWGTGWLAIKNVLLSSPPLFFTGICLFGGAIAIGAVRLCFGYPLQRGREGKGRLVVVGLLQMAGGLGLGLVGLQYFDAGTGALIFYTMPLWLVTLEWTSDRQTQSLLDLLALTCGMLGVGMLASGSIPVATSHGILGLALLSMAAFNWALGTWIHKRTPGDLDVWNRAVFQLATAGAIVIVASLLLERRLDWTQLPVLAWPLAFNLTVATGLAFVAWYRALRIGTVPRRYDLTRPKPANGSEHMEPGDVGCDTSLSPDEDRRRGRPCGFVHRRPEPVYQSGDSCGATSAPRARSARLRDCAGVPSQAHKA
jgi:drug/metabolite transporter (DMT)-like permease